MPTIKQIVIKESIKELKALQTQASASISKRISFLIVLKQNKVSSVSKRALSEMLGIDANSVTNWKKIYELHGISGILSDARGGYKPSIISSIVHKAIQDKLNDPKNGIRGYQELLEWVKKELSKDIKYITLLKYTERNFDSKIKVARKSHVKKDENLVADFKKTSEKNAQT
jgi:transposase